MKEGDDNICWVAKVKSLHGDLEIKLSALVSEPE